MNIPFVNLERHNKLHLSRYIQILTERVKKADFVSGKSIEEFETAFARFCKSSYCIGVNSGTDALFLTLIAHGIGQGDEVITVSNSYFATAQAIHSTGAKAVFVDIDPSSHLLDTAKITEHITSRTKAIIPVHLFGNTVDMNALIKITRKYKLILIEDACQAHGAKYQNKITPVHDTSAFSFYPGKNLGSFGDAGAVVTRNKKIAYKLKLLRSDGSIKKYVHTQFGYKSRMDTIQAAILLDKLPHLTKWNTIRQKHASTYTKHLTTISQVIPVGKNESGNHVYHLYVIEVPKRNTLQKYLFQKGISTIVHYPIPIHLQTPFVKMGYKHADLPVTEDKATKILSLPMYPELKDEEIRFICDHIADFYKK